MSGRRRPLHRVLAALPLAGWAVSGGGGTVHVAVASNFADAHARLAVVFEAGTGHRVMASSGSSGQLYAQIVHGAPFDVFLSADADRPRRLEVEGRGVSGTRFTYATGRLALYGPSLDSVRAHGADLHAHERARVAIANPVTAPYGAAALQVIRGLGLERRLAPRLVRGENIAQAFQFVESGAAELGFVARAQVLHKPVRSYWVVPPDRHDPLAHDAILLERARANPAARAYLEFLRGEVARRIIESFGYESS